MCICTVSFPAAGLHRMAGSAEAGVPSSPPVFVLLDKFKGKFLALLDRLYKDGSPALPDSCAAFRDPSGWQAFRDGLYRRDWCPFIKETFNGFGNAIEYLGRYTHKIAISNSRVLSVTETEVTFSARGLKPGILNALSPSAAASSSGASSAISFSTIRMHAITHTP